MSDAKLCPQCGTRYEPQHLFCTLDGATLVSSAPRTDLVGSVIADRYLVTDRLGDGGMGQVYLAEHVRMKRKCALKVMRPGLAADPDAVSRFNREAENASQVEHPNVAAIYDFGETADGLLYLAMEYVDGDSLARLVELERAIHPVRAAEIIRQAAAALDVAHARGILHRDLKPENIMITRTRDQLDLVKIVDFGIARAMTSDTQRVTRTGSMVGTPEYMSPEQFAGDVLDARSDIYSLALVAFNMLTGASAYPSGTSKENLIIRLTQPPRRLHEVKDLPWPESLQLTFDRALANSPSDRYESVLDFARDMSDAIASMPASQTGNIYLSALASALEARNAATPSRPIGTITNPGMQRVTGEGEVPASEAPARRPSPRMLLAAAAALTLLAVGAAVVIRGGNETGNPIAVADSVSAGDSVALAFTADSATVTGSGTSAPDEQELFNRVRSGVVAINSSQGNGVAFLVHSSGLLTTSSHLVPRDSVLNVMLDDTTRVRARSIVNDTARGVAVLAFAPSRCRRCATLALAAADTGDAAADSAAVIGVGITRPGRQRLVKGRITSFDSRNLRTTARAAANEAGAPLLTLSGEVIGFIAGGGSGAREVHFADIASALAAARAAAALPGYMAPSDSLLPVRPLAPFPAEPIAAVASGTDLDLLRKYRADGGSIHVLAMTPQLMAWRDARAKDALTARGAPMVSAAGAPITKMDPVQNWKDWDSCIRDRCAVIVLNVVPDRTPFLFHKPNDVISFSRGNVGRITLMRDGIPVEPIDVAYIPAVLNPGDHAAQEKPVFQQGLAVYRPREFAPRPAGGIAKYELVVEDLSRPGRPVRVTLEPSLIQAIINDFAPYGLTR